MIEEILSLFFVMMGAMYLSWILLLLLPGRNSVREKSFPSLSIIIPAHNEEAIIDKTIRSVLSATYPNEKEVIVVNDGSVDSTQEIVEEISRKTPEIKLINAEHEGKSKAINEGVKISKNDIILILDADSKVDGNALIEIVKPFSDPKIGAVSGVIRALDSKRIITWFQDFEYVLSSAWRYVCNKINGTYILPGFAAFRKSALLKVGGFSSDTLAEDFDIGLRLRKVGYGLIMSNAIIYTKVPQTLKELARQRTRWGRGTVQVIRKHLDVPFNRDYGAVGLYGIPTQMYWFVHGFVVLPITAYQILNGYFEYFVSYNNLLSMDVVRYFFGWVSMYGMVEYVYRTLLGEYILSLLFILIVGVFFLNMIYILGAIVKMSSISLRHFLVIFFFFPYSVLVLSLYVFPLLYEVMNPTYSNKWEKNV